MKIEEIYAYYLAKQAFKENKNIAKNIALETTLFLAQTRDISNALKKYNKKVDTNALEKALKTLDLSKASKNTLLKIEEMILSRL